MILNRISLAIVVLSTATTFSGAQQQESLGDIARRLRAEREARRAAEAAAKPGQDRQPRTNGTTGDVQSPAEPPLNSAETAEPAASKAVNGHDSKSENVATPDATASPTQSSSGSEQAIAAAVVQQLTTTGENLEYRICSEHAFCLRVKTADASHLAERLFTDESIARQLAAAGFTVASVHNLADKEELEQKYAMALTPRGWASLASFMNITDRAEYLALVIAENKKSSPDRLAAFQAALKAYPQSTMRMHMLDRILVAQMQTGDKNGSTLTAKEILSTSSADDLTRLRAFQSLAVVKMELVRAGIEAQSNLKQAKEHSRAGLDGLAQAAKPAAWTDAKMTKFRTELASYFQSVLNWEFPAAATSTTQNEEKPRPHAKTASVATGSPCSLGSELMEDCKALAAILNECKKHSGFLVSQSVRDLQKRLGKEMLPADTADITTELRIMNDCRSYLTSPSLVSGMELPAAQEARRQADNALQALDAIAQSVNRVSRPARAANAPDLPGRISAARVQEITCRGVRATFFPEGARVNGICWDADSPSEIGATN